MRLIRQLHEAMKTHNHTSLLFILTLFVASAPGIARAASLQITEIMYNPSGTGGAQWVELYNSNASAVTMAAGTKGWRVDDGGSSKHLLVDPASASPSGGRGTLTVGPQGFAIITNDPAGFIAQYGSAAYPVIKSAIAPKVSGATISLFDGAGALVAGATYTKDLGAYNDGNSLHLKGGAWVAGPSDPGIFSEQAASLGSPPSATPETPASVSDGASTTAANDVAQTAQKVQQGVSALNVPPLTTHIAATSPVVVGAGSAFSGTAFTAKGEPVPGARYVWNFGDGATLEGQKVFHTYMYPGNYALSLSVSSGYSMGTGYATLQAVPPQIALQVMPDGSAVVLNAAAQNIGVGLWSLGKSAGVFIIPENTVVLAKQSIRFSPTIMHFSAATDTALFYPNGVVAAVSGAEPLAPASAPTAIAPLPTSPVAPPVAKVPSSPAQARGTLVQKAAPKVSRSQPTSTEEKMLAGAASAVPEGSSSILWESLFGLGALVVLGVAGVWYGKPLLPGGARVAPVSGSDADDFAIDE